MDQIIDCSMTALWEDTVLASVINLAMTLGCLQRNPKCPLMTQSGHWLASIGLGSAHGS